MKKNINKNRLLLIASALLIIYLLLSIKLVLLTFTKSSNVNHVATLESNKFQILDNNNNLLATNIPVSNIFAHPKKIEDKHNAARQISNIIPSLSYKYVLSLLNKNKNFVWLKKKVTPSQEEKILALGYKGIDSQKVYKRFFPYASLTSHAVGYVDEENIGQSGIERYIQTSFTGIDNVNTSIDIQIQNIVSEQLDVYIEKFQAEGGVGIVVDVTNGEVAALVSKPDFDPNNFNKANDNAIFNKASLGVYEIGSVFKPVIMAIALDSNKVKLNDLYKIDSYRVGKYLIKDYYENKGWFSIGRILVKSSNTGMAQIAIEVGVDILYEYFAKLGLFSKTSIELLEKGRPLYIAKKDCKDLNLVTISYGHGISISPLHYVQAMLPIANGGIMHPITLLKNQHSEGVFVFKEKTSKDIMKLMRLVVTHGSGKRANIEGRLVAGKTGTANKSIKGGYDKKARYSSFTGIFPYHNPKYIVYIMLDNPRGIKETFGIATAALTAVPCVGEIITKIADVKNLQSYEDNPKELEYLLEQKEDEGL